MIKRIYVTKKPSYNIAEQKMKKEIKEILNIDVFDVQIFERYDIQDLEEEHFDTAIYTIFSDKPLDDVYIDKLPELENYKKFAIELLPGQFNQRADSAIQCVETLTQKEVLIACAQVFAIKGIDKEQLESIKKYYINPIECREASMKKPISLEQNYATFEEEDTIKDFINFDDIQIKEYYRTQDFAMTLEDLAFVRDYFIKEKRNPTITELKVIDTYWSDHCRHTTFLTELVDIEIDKENEVIKKAYDLYDKVFIEVHGEETEKYKCLMDMATIVTKKLVASNELDNLDISQEINACSVEVEVDNDNKNETWLIMFKNETHNHPTEIEPHGGAATCLGGAIRDPLSGRAYVYQGMRVSGGADPNEKIVDTMKGKLPQRIIAQKAALGFSSYGNQIGVPAGLVKEIYHDNYKAKRLEAGYVIGGAPKENIIRSNPRAGDLVLLVGGRTGRDGCGGATGSSQAHTEDSLLTCGAQVQKGNPSIERNIQRLFRNPKASKLIIRCNDFGAGGVSVAVGELADSLDIFLDKVPTKYAGLSGTELAISESQERMAVVINKGNLNKFLELCHEENLVAVNIAEVTSSGRMRMFFNDRTIVDLKRTFLDSNGVKQVARVVIKEKAENVICTHSEELMKLSEKDVKQAIFKDIAALKNCSQKGLTEMFDSSTGASTVISPLGGRYQLTPALVMASKPPVSGQTNTVTVSSFGCPIDLLEISPFKGAIYSIILSINKLIASGVPLSTVRLSLQEFFKRLDDDPERWGEVTSAMLGALYAQYNLGIGAIGGKDSMSGSFDDLDVPPTLISFAMGIGKADTLIDNVFKKGQKLFTIKLKRDDNFIPDFKYLKKVYNILNINIEKNNIQAATIVETNTMSAIIKSLLGDKSGISFAKPVAEMFLPNYGNFVIAVKDISQLNIEEAEYIGIVNDSGMVTGNNFEISIEEIYQQYSSTLEDVFPTVSKDAIGESKAYDYEANQIYKCKDKIAEPNIFIPVFAGTSGEDDLARRFSIAGGNPNIVVARNQSIGDIKETVEVFAKSIKQCQILALPGGCAMGNEPDGAGKYIATLLRSPVIEEAINDLLQNRDGLILGIGNGFQALVRMGLLPYGKLGIASANSPILTYNLLNRHVSTIAKIRVSSNLSPWLQMVEVGDVYCTPLSAGEGRFVAPPPELLSLVENGQIATQYVDLDSKVSMHDVNNKIGSMLAIEGITSPDGRIFGKMGHADRIGENLYKNVAGNYDMKIFESGIAYFK